MQASSLVFVPFVQGWFQPFGLSSGIKSAHDLAARPWTPPMNDPAGLPIEPVRRVLLSAAHNSCFLTAPGAPGAWTALSCSHKLPQEHLRQGRSGPGAAPLCMEAVGTLPSTPTELSPIIPDDSGVRCRPCRMANDCISCLDNKYQSELPNSLCLATMGLGKQRVPAAARTG